uniref:Uncharacterized protein n=1 Tax=Anguilla anguilla TaxID=7936 RepID=A0A0E9UZK5_ANGAN
MPLSKPRNLHRSPGSSGVA